MDPQVPDARPARTTGVTRKCTRPGPPAPLASAPAANVSTALFDLYDQMLGEVELPRVLRDVADVTCSDLNAERASIFLIEKETQDLVSAAVIGNVSQTIRVPINDTSLAGHCALSGHAFIVPDAYGDLSVIDPRLKFDRRWDERNNFRTRDVMCAPALHKGEIVGVVQVINSRHEAFTPADLNHLRLVARLVGYALYHARLYDDLATLKALEKQKAQFMRIMVHELKAPVAGAKTMADALQYHEAVSNSPALAVTQRISGRMGQLMDLIKDLLELARVKSGDPLGEVAIIDVAAEIESIREQYRDQAAAKSLELTVHLPDEPLHTRFDLQGFRLVLSNLVSNAVKYTPAGSVTITVQAEPKWVVVDVADTGLGIPEKDVPRLFEEFFRASNAKANNIEGTGVGLAGARSLVERFGGTFTLETAENKGSTFTVRVPRATGEATA